ncbi:T9SS type A sorting domain-containing protein, partial [Candidatus Eisenbacteria bacterium]
LHEFELEEGSTRFTMRDLGAGVDLGISLYPRGQAYLGKSDVLDEAISFMSGPGADESFTCNIPEAGRYAVAVWKVDLSGLDLMTHYELEIEMDPSAVPIEVLPSRQALAQNVPNPFNPGTTIHFDLPAETAVDLRVFDMSGRLVRVLLHDGAMAAGRHEVIWDGRDAVGGEMAAGVYFYRLETAESNETKQMILFK